MTKKNTNKRKGKSRKLDAETRKVLEKVAELYYLANAMAENADNEEKVGELNSHFDKALSNATESLLAASDVNLRFFAMQKIVDLVGS